MKLGRRKVENPATARRILAAAERHFAAQGMAGARTDEIAADAHANKAMLYYYFGTSAASIAPSSKISFASFAKWSMPRR